MTAVLKPRKGFEDLLRSKGFAFQVPPRPYTVLADDIRLRQNHALSLEEAREIQAKDCMRQGIPLIDWNGVGHPVT